jgi:hypothetical protein
MTELSEFTLAREQWPVIASTVSLVIGPRFPRDSIVLMQCSDINMLCSLHQCYGNYKHICRALQEGLILKVFSIIYFLYISMNQKTGS